MSEVGFMTMGRGGGGEDVPAIGVGMLGYAFMGKAHTNAYKKLPYMTWPPPFVPNLVAIAGRNEEAVAEAARRYGYAGYVTDWRAAALRRPHPAVRQLGTQRSALRADHRRRGGGQARDLREAARPRRGRVVRDLAARGGDRREAHVRLQLPLRAGRPARAPDPRVGRARRDQALPRGVPAGMGRGGDRRVALRQVGGGLRRARRPGRACRRPRPLPRRRDRVGLGDDGHVLAGSGGRRRRGVRRHVRERRRRDDRGEPLRDRAQELLHLGDQRRERVDRVRPRAPQRAPGALRRLAPGRARRRASATYSCRRPTTRSGSGGGRMATSSAGSTRSCTRSTTC